MIPPLLPSNVIIVQIIIRNPPVMVACVLLAFGIAMADEPRAPPPEVSPEQIKEVFFESLESAFDGPRPSLSSLRKSAKRAMAASAKASETPSMKPSDRDLWPSLISSTSIEDEIKIVRLRYDGLITSQGKFVGGGYQTARLELTILATLFAIISDYLDEIRWKPDAASARDLLARTAKNCNVGTALVFKEAKLRKSDLQDLVSGSGLTGRDRVQGNDWSMIADRAPLMEYAQQLLDALKDDTRDERSMQKGRDDVLRRIELLAMLGEVFAQEGMAGSGEKEYRKLSRDMTQASREVLPSLERSDHSAVRIGVAAIGSRCDACHADYR